MSALALLVLLLIQGKPAQTNGTVAGQLQTMAGEPAREVRVQALAALDGGAPDAGNLMLAGIAETDANGRYRLENVPPGRYYITAGQLDSLTYYPGLATTAGARLITIAPGETIRDVDFSLVRPTVVTVRGKVKGALPGALAAGLVRPILTGAGRQFEAVAQPDGAFEFTKVAPGAYTLYTITGIGPGAAITVVGDKAIAGLEINSPPMLLGRVTVDDGSKLPVLGSAVASGVASPVTPLRIQAPSIPGAGPLPVRADGVFLLTNFVQEFRIDVSVIPFGYSVKSIRQGSVDLTQTNVTAPQAGAVPDEIRVILTRTAGVTVSGRVTGLPEEAATNPPRISMTALTSISASGALLPGPSFGEAQLRPDGTFEIREVPPGKYVARMPVSNSGATLIAVEDRNVTGVEVPAFAVFALGSRSGCGDGALGILRIDDGSSPPASVELEINGARVASVQRGLCTGLNIDVFRDDLSGGSNIRSLPGQDLRVRVTRLPLGYYVMSMTFGALDLANGPVRLPAFLGNSKIEVVLTKTLPSGARPGTKVRGQTSGLYLPRRSDIRLALTPVSQPAGMIERTGQMFVFADGMTGTFEIPDMTPGRYRLSVAGISATSLGLDDDFAGASVTFDVGQSDVTNLEARFEPTSIRRVEREQPVAQTPASTVSLDGTVQVDGAIPQFEIRFTPTQSSATPSVRISGSEFSIELPEGEYSRVVISDLPNGFTVTSVSAGPLDLRSPFLVSAAGIRDRLTGKFVGAESGKARITIRLSSPGLRP